MNKRAIVAAMFLSANLVSPALAGGGEQCKPPSSPLSSTNINAAFVGSGFVTCYPATGPNWENQETLNGGSITDYKQGPSSKTDPTATVGTYAVSGSTDGIISYKYGSAAASEFYVTLVSGTQGGNAFYNLYGPIETRSGTCPMYGEVQVKVSNHCS